MHQERTSWLGLVVPRTVDSFDAGGVGKIVIILATDCEVKFTKLVYGNPEFRIRDSATWFSHVKSTESERTPKLHWHCKLLQGHVD